MSSDVLYRINFKKPDTPWPKDSLCLVNKSFSNVNNKVLCKFKYACIVYVSFVITHNFSPDYPTAVIQMLKILVL